MPSEEHFSDLIDSMVNLVDEGFSKSIKDGLEISSVGDSTKLISFYKTNEDENSIWAIETEKESNNLAFSNEKKEKVLSLNEEGRVGIGTNNPENTLDVNGIISAQGRIGTYKTGLVPADGKWHPIITGLDGCHAFEVMAGVGKKKSGKYALMHAHALNTFNSESRIYYHQAFFRILYNRIKLRWTGSMHNYTLEMKTRSNYGENISVNYSIGKLWFDPFMDQCSNPNDMSK